MKTVLRIPGHVSPRAAGSGERINREMSKAGAELKALMLRSPGLTLAAAESLTCGRVQARVGEISGASEFFSGGITAYSLEQKVRHLGVDRAAARRVKSVSAGVAEQMACGVCRLFGSDLGVATTGYAERSPDENVADPFAWWALAYRRRGRFVTVKRGRVECPGAKRVDAQMIVADAVLAELIEWLRGLRAENAPPIRAMSKRRLT